MPGRTTPPVPPQRNRRKPNCGCHPVLLPASHQGGTCQSSGLSGRSRNPTPVRTATQRRPVRPGPTAETTDPPLPQLFSSQPPRKWSTVESGTRAADVYGDGLIAGQVIGPTGDRDHLAGLRAPRSAVVDVNQPSKLYRVLRGISRAGAGGGPGDSRKVGAHQEATSVSPWALGRSSWRRAPSHRRTSTPR